MRQTQQLQNLEHDQLKSQQQKYTFPFLESTNILSGLSPTIASSLPSGLKDVCCNHKPIIQSLSIGSIVQKTNTGRCKPYQRRKTRENNKYI